MYAKEKTLIEPDVFCTDKSTDGKLNKFKKKIYKIDNVERAKTEFMCITYQIQLHDNVTSLAAKKCAASATELWLF